ncbi:endonuclease domain-containing protein [Lacisediminihabitans sp. FW035]
MTRAAALPPGLPAHGFTVGTARNFGIAPSRLRAGDLDNSVWGVRAMNAPADLRGRCALLQLRIPERAFFSHSTAALLYGIPLPWASEHAGDLHVAVPSPSRALSAIGVVGHRLAVMPTDVNVLSRLRVTSVTRTWTDLADQLAFEDLVAAGDFLIHWRQPLTTTTALEEAIRLRCGRRGSRALSRAVQRLNERAESPPESWLRLILEDAGFPPPHINREVTDHHGEFVARTDFIFEGLRLVLEYQGDYHRTTKGQWRADMTRRSKLEANGWRVMELNADDLKDPAELVARIRRLLAHR